MLSAILILILALEPCHVYAGRAFALAGLALQAQIEHAQDNIWIEAYTFKNKALAYAVLLFGIAYIGDKRPLPTRSLPAPLIYSLALGVYCSSWTFFGAVGRATSNGWDFLAIYLGPALVFALAYLLVMTEEFTHLRKSKPVIAAAGIIWAMIGYVYVSNGMSHEAEVAVRHNLLEYAELMLFLLVAMTYINAMEERQVFDALRSWLIRRRFGFRALFWLTGTLASVPKQ